MRFDKWFRFGWAFNLSFLVLSSASLAYLVLISNNLPLDFLLGNLLQPLELITMIPAPVLFLLLIPFFASGYFLLAMGILEVFTSKKEKESKAAWIIAMLVFGVIVTVVYYFFSGRDQLTD